MSSSGIEGRVRPDIRAKVMPQDLTAALFIEATRQGAVELLPKAQGLTQITNGRSRAHGVGRLLVGRECREIGAKGVHAASLPFGKSLSSATCDLVSLLAVSDTYRMDRDRPKVAARRKALRKWIDESPFKLDVDFARSIGMSTGELSGLLSNKSFGEIKAENIERAAKMPAGYLVSPGMAIAESRAQYAPLMIDTPDQSQSVSDLRQNMSAVKRLADYIHDVALEPIPAEREDELIHACIDVVLQLGADSILNGDTIANAAKAVASRLKNTA